MTQDDAKNRPAQTACCPVEVSKEAVDWASNEAAGIEAAGLQPNAVDSTPLKQISTAIHDNERIPEECIAYIEQRTIDEFYDFVMTEFKASKESVGLTKAMLAKRIGLGPEQVNRLLAHPGNWTIHTVARLLLGIAGKEAILNSSSIFNRPPSNMRDEPTSIQSIIP